MAPLLLKLLSALLIFFLLFPEGEGARCHLGNMVIKQDETGRIVEGSREYEVTVSNMCECSQSNVVVQCFGLGSFEEVDPNAINPTDDTNCIINRGLPMPGGMSVKFRYAWMTPQDFPLVSSLISCK